MGSVILSPSSYFEPDDVCVEQEVSTFYVGKWYDLVYTNLLYLLRNGNSPSRS